MAFKTKKERYAYVKGIKKGMRGGKTYGKKKKSRKKKPRMYRNTPPAGAYNRFGRVNENRVDDLYGPVVFWDGSYPF